MSEVADQSEASKSAADQSDQVAVRLRRAREEAGLSLRELSRRLELSASALSQIETGKSRPSVKTLYAIVSELGISLDELFANRATPGDGQPGGRAAEATESSAAASADAASSPPAQVIQRGDARARLELDSGVTWERLTAAQDPDVDFLFTTYQVGGASSSNEKLVRHSGREYGIVLSGELELTVGFETEVLKPGDAASFDSQEPHLLANRGKVPATAIWFVIGRRQSDPRSTSFSGSDGG
jgi:transcriptional regulator with XRE-family HTH domain